MLCTRCSLTFGGLQKLSWKCWVCACSRTRGHLQEEPARTGLGWEISQITTEQQQSSLLSVSHIESWKSLNVQTPHSCITVSWKTLLFKAVKLKEMVFTFIFWLISQKRASPPQKNRPLLSVLLLGNLLTLCGSRDFAVK